MIDNSVLPSTAWDDIYVGKDLGARTVEVTPDLVARFVAGCDDDHPWYTGDSPFGGSIAPALIACQEPWRFGGWYPADMRGNLHAKQEWDLFAPIAVGSSYLARALVLDRYLWRGNRHVIVNEVTISDAAGRPLARGRTHQSFLLEQPEGMVVGRDRERSATRRIEPNLEGIHERLDGPPLEMSPGRCLAVADGLVNYHSDAEIAAAMGFPAVVVQGVFNLNAISALMTRRFGAGWFCGGKLRVSVTNVLWGGDTARAHVGVKTSSAEPPRRRAECEVWVDKLDGTVTAVGTASALEAADPG